MGGAGWPASEPGVTALPRGAGPRVRDAHLPAPAARKPSQVRPVPENQAGYCVHGTLSGSQTAACFSYPFRIYEPPSPLPY